MRDHERSPRHLEWPAAPGGAVGVPEAFRADVARLGPPTVPVHDHVRLARARYDLVERLAPPALNRSGDAATAVPPGPVPLAPCAPASAASSAARGRSSAAASSTGRDGASRVP